MSFRTAYHSTAGVPHPVPTRASYTILWICTLRKEYIVARAMLEVTHPNIPLPSTDFNTYSLGSIGRHNVVITLLEAHGIGILEPEAVAAKAKETFRRVRFALVVGTGGGFPSLGRDLRLGDVIVGVASIQQWDHGILFSNSLDRETAGMVVPAPEPLATAIDRLQRQFDRDRHGNRISSTVEALAANTRALSPYARPVTLDVLFRDDYEHRGAAGDCSRCDHWRGAVNRLRRRDTFVAVHYGLVASGRTAVRGPWARNAIRHLLGDVLCVEGESTGVMAVMPCLVIRGVCDYADRHGNNWWQEYAAATAAVYARQLLEVLELDNSYRSSTRG